MASLAGTQLRETITEPALFRFGSCLRRLPKRIANIRRAIAPFVREALCGHQRERCAETKCSNEFPAPKPALAERRQASTVANGNSQRVALKVPSRQLHGEQARRMGFGERGQQSGVGEEGKCRLFRFPFYSAVIACGIETSRRDERRSSVALCGEFRLSGGIMFTRTPLMLN